MTIFSFAASEPKTTASDNEETLLSSEELDTFPAGKEGFAPAGFSSTVSMTAAVALTKLGVKRARLWAAVRAMSHEKDQEEIASALRMPVTDFVAVCESISEAFRECGLDAWGDLAEIEVAGGTVAA